MPARRPWPEHLDADCATDAKYWLGLDYAEDFKFSSTCSCWRPRPISLRSGCRRTWSWPDGDPRATPAITCEQAQYMLDQFDNNMYPQETEFFGTPDSA